MCGRSARLTRRRSWFRPSRVGNRDRATAIAFVRDVAERMKYRVQVSTDGLNAYVDAMELHSAETWTMGR